MSRSDLEALSARISRLETLLGETKQTPCIHEATKTAQQDLRKRVPDELAAAYQIVNSLSNLTSTSTTIPTLENLESLLPALNDLQTLLPRLRAPSTSQIDQSALSELQIRTARIVDVVRREERAVDELLLIHNEHISRVNNAISSLAKDVISLIQSSSNAVP